MPRNVVVLLNSEEGRALVRAACQEISIPFSAFEELVEAELDQQGKQRKAGLWEQFDQIFGDLDDRSE